MYILDEREALEAMSSFVQAWYELGHSDDSDLVAVLSEIEILNDGGTGDPAAWPDWLGSVKKVVAKRDSGELGMRRVPIDPGFPVEP